jgi:hypothetical protein
MQHQPPPRPAPSTSLMEFADAANEAARRGLLAAQGKQRWAPVRARPRERAQRQPTLALARAEGALDLGADRRQRAAPPTVPNCAWARFLFLL